MDSDDDMLSNLSSDEDNLQDDSDNNSGDDGKLSSWLRLAQFLLFVAVAMDVHD